jgi:hypothetical protein
MDSLLDQLLLSVTPFSDLFWPLRGVVIYTAISSTILQFQRYFLSMVQILNGVFAKCRILNFGNAPSDFVQDLIFLPEEWLRFEANLGHCPCTTG